MNIVFQCEQDVCVFIFWVCYLTKIQKNVHTVFKNLSTFSGEGLKKILNDPDTSILHF